MFVLEENFISHILKEEKAVSGFEVSTGHFTSLFGVNAEAVKSKPLLVYQSENPRTQNGYTKTCITVVGQSPKRAWMTMLVLEFSHILFFHET
jgi:hypothetical protein